MILDKLNEEQKNVVRHTGNILLTACPGSGKTRVIIHKLAYEIHHLPIGSKKKIVALTFTVRASEEIFRRLNNMGVLSYRIWTGTIHAFCLEWILRPYSCYLDELQHGYSIADESFTADLIGDLMKKHKVQKVNRRIKRDGTFVATDVKEVALLTEYYQILSDKQQIDFELILYYSYKILIKHPNIQKTLSNLIHSICVDEYQDTQDLQYAILTLIVKAGRGNTNIIFVGDTDQAVYTSLGGVAKNYSEIQSELDGLPITELSLTGNFRSNQRIIDFYRNFQTKLTPIVAVGAKASDVGLISLNNTIHKDNIPEEIARLIQKSIGMGIPEDEICVLVPQWWLITNISKKLRTLLPTVNFDASGLTPMSKNRDNIWYKLSRLFLTQANPKIYSARYRWAHEVLEEFRKYTHSIILDEDAEKTILKTVNSIKSTETEGIEYLTDCFTQFTSILSIEYKEFPLLMEYWTLFFDTIKKRINDVEYSMPSDIESFKSFYREATGVVINTCIGVKGEEYETVIAYGLLYGYIPHWDEVYNGNPEEASKKLMYVICSRAKSNLHLIAETGRSTPKGTAYGINKHLGAVTFNYDTI